MSTDATAALTGRTVPRLSRHVRMRFDPTRERHVLLGPESVIVLNGTGTDVLELCDGRSVGEIVDELERRYGQVGNPEVGAGVRSFLAGLVERHCVRLS